MSQHAFLRKNGYPNLDPNPAGWNLRGTAVLAPGTVMQIAKFISSFGGSGLGLPAAIPGGLAAGAIPVGVSPNARVVNLDCR